MQESLENNPLSLDMLLNVDKSQKLINASIPSGEFEWPEYKNDMTRIKAMSIKYKNMTAAKAFSAEYGVEINLEGEEKYFGKDFKVGELVTITGINGVLEHDVFFEMNNTTIISVDMRKEKRFLDLIGETVESFLENCKSKEYREAFVEKKFKTVVTDSKPVLRVSLLSGIANTAKDEFLEQIKKPTSAYNAKIIGKNRGGFIIDVMGVQAFLPGSLAAANKIIDFDEYIGKTVIVMVEDYLSEINTFIFSHKKYLEVALPSLIKNYDWSKQHTGTVTGCNKYGVFVEFYDTITGLLHVLKMNEETKNRFESRGFKPGDEITCYVHDIQNNKLVLTDFEPGSAEDSIQVGTQQKGKVVSTAKIGTFVHLKTGETGVIRKGKKQYKKGDIVNVEVTEVTEDKKIFFKEVEKEAEATENSNYAPDAFEEDSQIAIV